MIGGHLAELLQKNRKKCDFFMVAGGNRPIPPSNFFVDFFGPQGGLGGSSGYVLTEFERDRSVNNQ